MRILQNYIYTYVISFKFVWLYQSWFNFDYISFATFHLRAIAQKFGQFRKIWFNTCSWVKWVQRPRFAHNLKHFRVLIFGHFVKICSGLQFHAKLLTNLHTLIYSLFNPKNTNQAKTRSVWSCLYIPLPPFYTMNVYSGVLFVDSFSKCSYVCLHS